MASQPLPHPCWGLSRRHLQASPQNFCTSDAPPTDPTTATLYPGSSIVEKETGVGGWGVRGEGRGGAQDLHGELTDKVLIEKRLQIVSLLVILLITGLCECGAEGVWAPMTRFKQRHS